MDRDREYYLVKCRTCGAANRVPAKMAGKPGRCGECHGTLPVLYLEPLVLGDTTFRDFLQAYNGPVIAEFWAPWWPHCQNLAPVVREVARELAGMAAVIQVNTDQNPGLASSYQIKGIPALLVIHGGQVVARTSGGMNKEALLNWIRRAL